MEFDIKDVKSWATRHDVKIGAEGYFCNRVSDLDDMEDTKLSKIESICNNQANCFSSTAFYGSFSFFLPLSAVKEDKTKINIDLLKTHMNFISFFCLALLSQGKTLATNCC